MGGYLRSKNLEQEFGGIVRGMAYANGVFNDQVVEVLHRCGIAYARTTIPTYDFCIPEDWLRLNPTCHHVDPRLSEICDRFLAEKPVWDARLFYLWGHSYEFERDDNWDVIRDFAKKMGGHADIWYATNIEIYNYIAAYKQLIVSVEGKRIYNPTATKLWFEMDHQPMTIEPGQMLELD